MESNRKAVLDAAAVLLCAEAAWRAACREEDAVLAAYDAGRATFAELQAAADRRDEAWRPYAEALAVGRAVLVAPRSTAEG